MSSFLEFNTICRKTASMHLWIIGNQCLVQIMLLPKTEAAIVMHCMYVRVYYDDVCMHVHMYVHAQHMYLIFSGENTGVLVVLLVAKFPLHTIFVYIPKGLLGCGENPGYGPSSSPLTPPPNEHVKPVLCE